jgi:5-methyltetrahydrofolate--homocysteine methyltransferase
VDEVSYHLDVQKQAMAWLVRTVQEVSSVPPSVDSSNSSIIATGLEAYDGRAGQPMVNSLALERLEVLELVKQHNSKVIVTAAGQEGMPQDAQERVDNVNKIMEVVLSKGVPLNHVYVDALVLPISVSSQHGHHYLDAVRRIRETYGSQVHITGGLSNISFGLPKRKLINDVFIYFALEAGIDCGIIDPVQSPISDVFNLDERSEPVQMARAALLGEDEMCINYIQAWRAGKI